MRPVSQRLGRSTDIPHIKLPGPKQLTILGRVVVVRGESPNGVIAGCLGFPRVIRRGFLPLGRNDSQLLHHTHDVGDLPVFDHFAVGDPNDVYLGK